MSPSDERLVSVTAQGFRGAPQRWTVDLGGRSLVVLGENGTGKSTIADALEFLYAGRLEGLSHEGRGRALAHVGGSDPTRVEIRTAAGRVVSRHLPPQLSDPPAVNEMFLLRGRTIAEFIEKPKAQKWRVLAELLGLDRIDGLRLTIQKVRNDLNAEVATARSATRTARRALGAMARGSDDDLLRAIQDAAGAAEVVAPQSLTEALDPAWAARNAPRATIANRSVQLADYAARVDALKVEETDLQAVDRWNTAVADRPPTLDARLALLRTGRILLEVPSAPASCPLCGQAVDMQQLAASVVDTLEALENADREAAAARAGVEAVLSGVAAALDLRTRLWSEGERLGLSPPALSVADPGPLRAALAEGKPLDPAEFQNAVRSIVAWDAAAHALIRDSVRRSVDPKAGALVDLGVLLERGRAHRDTTDRQRQLEREARIAESLLAQIQTDEHALFSQILDRISVLLGRLYEALHPGERIEHVRVEPWSEKGVELSVDFHGHRMKPPHGVLSESHLNSLAIALFLGMARTFNRTLGFLVLDDVINSFDAHHRARLADVLVAEFADLQLIVLTHDPSFFERLRRSGWKTLELTSWTFDDGPRTSSYVSSDLLAGADRALADGDRQAAATKIRRCLEETLQEAAEAIGARLPFRRGTRNDIRELKELLDAVRGQVRKTAPRLHKDLDTLFMLIDADSGSVLNVETHAGRGSASADEVRDALGRARSLDERLTCSSCGTRIWTVGTVPAATCRCGKVRLDHAAPP